MPPVVTVLLFFAVFAAVVGLGIFGDDLAGQTRPPAAGPVQRHVAVASPSATQRSALTPPPTPAPTIRCEPPTIEPLVEPIERHPGPLVPTRFVSMVAPSEADGRIVVDGLGVAWSYGPGRLGRLDAAGHVVDSWTVADDARFGAASVAPAREGGVWLVGGGTNEVAWFDGRAFRDIVPTPGAAYSVAEAGDGTLWAGINVRGPDFFWGDLAHWDGAHWTGVCTGMPEAYLDPLVLDGRGAVWMLAYDRNGAAEARRFDGRAWTEFGPDTDPLFVGPPPQALAVAPDGAVWVAFERKLARFDGTTWVRVDVPPTVDLSGITALAVDAGGVVWIGAGRLERPPETVLGAHVVRFDGRVWRVFGDDDGLPVAPRGWWAVVMSLAVEPRGIVAVTPRGVYGPTGNRWERIDHHAGPVDAIAVAAMSTDEAWVATSTDGLWHHRAGRWVRDNPPGAAGWPRALVRGPSRTIAYATNHLVAVNRSGSWSVVLETADDLGPVAVAFAPDGVLWVSVGDASNLAGFRWAGRAWVPVPVEPGPSSVWPTTIAFDRLGAPWLIGDGWVPRSVRLVGARWEMVTVEAGWTPSGGMITDPDGTVWLTLRKGAADVALGAFDGRDWRVVKLDADVDYLSAQAFTDLSDGAILVGCSEGLARYDGRNWAWLIRGVDVGAAAAGGDGSVWVSGSLGLVRMHLDAG